MDIASYGASVLILSVVVSVSFALLRDDCARRIASEVRVPGSTLKSGLIEIDCRAFSVFIVVASDGSETKTQHTGFRAVLGKAKLRSAQRVALIAADATCDGERVITSVNALSHDGYDAVVFAVRSLSGAARGWIYEFPIPDGRLSPAPGARILEANIAEASDHQVICVKKDGYTFGGELVTAEKLHNLLETNMGAGMRFLTLGVEKGASWQAVTAGCDAIRDSGYSFVFAKK